MGRHIGVVGSAFLAAVVVAALLQSAAAQTTHVVGEGLGWLVPPGGPITYATWVSTQTFTVGDVLVFNFTTGQHDVAKVTKAGFDACNGTSTIGSILTTGPARITLDSAGEHYFICTFNAHCALGQKLAINVTAAPGPTTPPTSSASPPPTTPSPVSAPAPAREPTTYVVGDALGWLVPPGGPIAYATWAFGKTFMVGDTLLFNFTTGQHDVAKVTKAGFDACNGTNTIGSIITNGPARITLDSAGEHYFICTFNAHCPLGQKLAINVTAAPGPATPPTSSASPPSTNPSPVSAPAPAREPTTYVVGDGLGWLVPPGGSIAYATWAFGKNFMVGDTLVFNFVGGQHDVAEVRKAAFDSCNTTSTVGSVITTSPARITLTSAGEHYYICTFSQHCPLGQKLAINVTASGTSAPAPSRTATPPSRAATPPSTIATSPSGTPSSPAPTAGGSTSSSAPSLAVAGFSVTLLSTVVAFFL